MRFPALSILAVSLVAFCAAPPTIGRKPSQAAMQQSAAPAASTESLSKQPASASQPSSEEELQRAIASAGNDRAALVRNLEGFLAKYPEAQNKTQIYRALVEAYAQLHDDAHAASYAERIVALQPEDIAMTAWTIQLLERTGGEPELRRATTYATRILEFVDRSSLQEKSPRVSQESWAENKRRDRASVFSLRGRLELKLKEDALAQKDFEESYSLLPSAAAAEELGEIAELKKDLPSAIQQYSRAFALSDASSATSSAISSRREIRQKLGNVWRLAHGSDNGLGDYLLRVYDDVSAASSAKPRKSAEAHEPSEFTLRKAPDGTPFPLKTAKGKVMVLNFWATWCGPCHALEPLFARVAAQFRGMPEPVFLSANCDEDETLVAPYLQQHKSRTEVVFADGLDRFYSIENFPTVLVIGRDGKVAFRVDGFDPSTFESSLSAAVARVLSAQPPSQP